MRIFFPSGVMSIRSIRRFNFKFFITMTSFFSTCFTSNSWFNDHIQDPQLPIYALKSSPNAIAFAIISQDKLKWSSICDPTIPNPFPPNSNVRIPNEIQVEIGWPDWNNLLSFWENKLTWLAEEFTQGQIQINPIKKNETCRNCGYSMLCRIAESASSENNLGNLDG